jgi:hypothetical protein
MGGERESEKRSTIFTGVSNGRHEERSEVLALVESGITHLSESLESLT